MSALIYMKSMKENEDVGTSRFLLEVNKVGWKVEDSGRLDCDGKKILIVDFSLLYCLVYIAQHTRG